IDLIWPIPHLIALSRSSPRQYRASMSGRTKVESTSEAAAVAGPGYPKTYATLSQSCSSLTLGSSPKDGIGLVYHFLRYGMLYPLLSTSENLTSPPYSSRNALAAAWFFENFQIPRIVGSTTANRPAGPRGSRPSIAMFTLLYSVGLLSWIDRIAEIASWIQIATPESR